MNLHEYSELEISPSKHITHCLVGAREQGVVAKNIEIARNTGWEGYGTLGTDEDTGIME